MNLKLKLGIMIKEITKENFLCQHGDVIFPHVRIMNYDLDELLIETFVDVGIDIGDEYLISIQKKVDSPDCIIDYAKLMRFIDSMMNDINRMKANKSIPDSLLNGEVIGIYKIIK